MQQKKRIKKLKMLIFSGIKENSINFVVQIATARWLRRSTTTLMRLLREKALKIIMGA